MLGSNCWEEQIKLRILKHHITRASLSYRYNPDEWAFEAGSLANMSICKWCRERLSKSLCPKEPPLEWPPPRLEDLQNHLNGLLYDAGIEDKGISEEIAKLESQRKLLAAFSLEAPQRLQELRGFAEGTREDAEKLSERISLYRDEIEGMHTLRQKLNGLVDLLETFLGEVRQEEDELKIEIDKHSQTNRKLQQRISVIEQALELVQGTGPCTWIEEGVSIAKRT